MAYPRSKMLDFTAFPPAAVTMFSEKKGEMLLFARIWPNTIINSIFTLQREVQ